MQIGELEITETVQGYIAVIGAIIFFGSNYLPAKLPWVQKAKVDPIVFQCYSSTAIFACSWLILIVEPIDYSWWGVVSAALWVPAATLGLFAVNFSGLAIAQGIWSGTIIIVSFCWGAFAFHEDITNWKLTILGLVFLLLGVAGISFCNKQWTISLPWILRWMYLAPCFARPENPLSKLGRTSDSTSDGSDEESGLLSSKESPKNYYLDFDSGKSTDQSPFPQPPSGTGASPKLLIGVLIALVSGGLSGSMMAPAEFVHETHVGRIYIFSFGTGAGMMTALMAILYFAFRVVSGKGLPSPHFKVALIPGLCTGIIWTLANYCRVYATLYLGMTIGYPLTQMSLVMAGVWGMVLFREITRSMAVLVFCFSVCLIIAGAFLLGFYG